MFTFKTQPQSMGAIIGDGFRLYRASISKIWYWQIIFMLPGILLGALNEVMDPSGEFAYTSFSLAYFIFSVAASALIAVFALCFVYKRIFAVGTQEDSSIKTTARQAIRKALPILIGLIFSIAIIIGVAVGIILLFSFIDNLIFAIAGLIVAYLAVLILLVFFLFFPQFILFENKGVFGAIGNSFSHVWGNFLRTLTTLLLVMLTIALIGLLVIAPFFLLLFFADSPAMLIFSIVGTLIGYLLVAAFVVPMFHNMVLIMFNDLKVRKVLLDKQIAEEEA